MRWPARWAPSGPTLPARPRPEGWRRPGSVYCRHVKSTTIKVLVETRDRIRSLGGETYEATIVDALDALDADRFWAQAEVAAEWRDSLPSSQRLVLDARDAAVDAAFDGIE